MSAKFSRVGGMRESRNFSRGGGAGVQARLLENSSDSSDDVFLVLNLFCNFTVVYQLFISKKTIISQGFRGVQHFPGGGGGGGGLGVQHFTGGQTFSRVGDSKW